MHPPSEPRPPSPPEDPGPLQRDLAVARRENPTRAEAGTSISRRRFLGRDAYRSPREACPEHSEDPGRRADYWIRVHRRAMACRFEVTLGGEEAQHVHAARQALDEVDRIEAQITVFRETSALTHINRCAASGPVEVTRDLYELLTLCQHLHHHTGGAFDVTSTPLSRCWGFMRRQGRLPAAREIAAAKASVGMDRVAFDAARHTVCFLHGGMELNLGAIGKGWALDRIAEGLRRKGCGPALLSAGHSSVLAAGRRGQGWPIDLTSPRKPAPIGRVHLRDGALGTSGAGEQFFEVDGLRYGHVLDPRTGWPARGLMSVSVLASQAATADALSTAFLVGGVDLARRYCAAHPFVMAILTPDAGSRAEVVGDYPGATVDLA